MKRARPFDTISPFSCLICPGSIKAAFSASITRTAFMSGILWARQSRLSSIAMRPRPDAFIERSKQSGGAMKVKVFTDGFEGHVRRSLDRARKRERGERLEPEKIITFANPLDLLECLTANRVRLCQGA